MRYNGIICIFGPKMVIFGNWGQTHFGAIKSPGLRLGLFIAPKCVKSQNQLHFHTIKTNIILTIIDIKDRLVLNLDCFDCLTGFGDKHGQFAQDSQDFVGGKKPQGAVGSNGAQIGEENAQSTLASMLVALSYCDWYKDI